jgi:ribonuclease R
MRKKPIQSDIDKGTVLDLFKREKKPLSLGELLQCLPSPFKSKRTLKTILKAMTREGSIIMLKNNRYGLPREMNLVTGTLQCTRSGNGFVVPDGGEMKDVFVPSRDMKDAFHGDKVIARVEHSYRGKREGRIIKIVERGRRDIVGFVRRARERTYLVPEDEKMSAHFLIVPDKRKSPLVDGDLVAAHISRYPEGGGDPECRVLRVFKGLTDVPSISKFVSYKHSLPARFKSIVTAESERINPTVALNNRNDLRKKSFVTIDGEFAKDFDDAVYVEKTTRGYTLFVSIADVSHYVFPGSGLDREAYDRGTSVYFPGSVVPMLPEELSNGLCSLRPGEDRYTVTVQMEFDGTGTAGAAHFYPSVIRSARRLTYTVVENGIVRGQKEEQAELRGVVTPLKYMLELATLLAERRGARGSLDFDLPEPDLVLDMEGGVKGILRAERLFSHRLIEEFMVSANEAVARFVSGKNVPIMYRIHEPPDTAKLMDFQRLLQALGVGYGKDMRNVFSLQSILRNVEKTEYEFLVNRVLLRCMKQAKYSPVNVGHFGLASKSYLHFTSPIRRYPDLVCHRVLKSIIDKGYRYGEAELESMAIHLSQRERVAMEVEREVEDRVRVLFMTDKIGEAYDGIISHITSFGFFVELLDVFVEGLVLLSEMGDDYYHYQEDRFRLLGRRTRKVYRIGDRVRIRVTMADTGTNRLHFTLA